MDDGGRAGRRDGNERAGRRDDNGRAGRRDDGAGQQEADPADAPESAGELPAQAQMVAADPLFDEAFYARALGISGSRLDLAAHYLATGEAALLPPSLAFDVRFYRDANPDVAQGGGSPLLHYLVHGRDERRYPNRRALRRDAERVAASGLFDARAYAWDRGRPARHGFSDAEDYLVSRNHRATIGDAFDSAFYARAYEDVGGEASGYAMPILHYIEVGRAELRPCTEQQLLRHTQEEQAHFNERYYLDQYRRRFPGQPVPDDPLRHYILAGARLGLDPAPDFSAEYYLRCHPDLRQCGLTPFLHYALYGKAEGRVGRPDFTSSIARGDAEFDSGKPTLLIANHEASRTGAPLVGLNVGAAFADTHNVVAYLGAPGPLERDFAARSCAVVTGPFSALDAEYLLRELKDTHGLSAVLMNSVETDAFAPAALQTDLPSVALVHEFAEYTLPTGRMSAVVELVDRVITPASLIRDSAQAELLATRSDRANNLAVRPQGALPNLPPGDNAAEDLAEDDIRALIGAAPGAEQVKVVLGAGRVQMRKGVDLFVQTAAEARRIAGDGIRFVWVGDGYSPGTDVHYSAWIADMVRRLDLENHVFFLPAQGSLEALFAVSDVFYLPSRLDPFPNVALDALRAGRAVVCFDRATGVVDALSDAPDRKAAVGAAVAYCDVREAAKALVRLLQPAEAKRALGNAALARRRFAFADYVAAVSEEFKTAAALREAAMQAADAVLASGRFDAAFHDNLPAPAGPPRLRAAVREYVSRGQKGIVACNPCPGFNEGVARLRLTQPGPALAGPDISPTHRCVVLGDEAPPAAPLRAALHVHLHYPELAPEFAARLSAARGAGSAPLDLILTTTSDARRIEVEYAFRGYKNGSARTVVVPNRGRDIGPFLTEVGPLMQAGEYDVIGHLHGKRSLSVDAGLGDRWRGFLLDTLLGGAAGLSAIWALFAGDPGLGLVFAEDRHCVGWSKNRPVAEALAARMQPAPALPDWPVFPIGTMFWARPAAVAPLWALGLESQDLPGEPVAYDGTALHAIERMLPAVCEAAGHGWCTVHREGAGW